MRQGRRRPAGRGEPIPEPVPESVASFAAKFRAAIALMRPAHWLKNAFVLVGLIYGHVWRDTVLLIDIAWMFAAFCLAASAVYAFNDAVDAAHDRLHGRKARRPVANGSLSRRAALALALSLACLALAVSAPIGWRPLAAIGAYLSINLAYSLVLKRHAVIDVACIAAGFVIRLLAGTWAVGIVPSSWMLACGLVFTVFLALGKRRAELADALETEQSPAAARAALAGYSLGGLDWAMTVSGALTLLAYGAYTLSPETKVAHGTPWLVATVPLVALALGRYTYLVHRRRGGDDPAAAVLSDALLSAACVAFAAATVMIVH